MVSLLSILPCVLNVFFWSYCRLLGITVIGPDTVIETELGEKRCSFKYLRAMSADCVMLNTHCARLDPPHLQPVSTPYRGSGYEMYPIEAGLHNFEITFDAVSG